MPARTYGVISEHFFGTLGQFRSLFYTNIRLVKIAPNWPHLSLKVYCIGLCYMVF